MVGCDEQGGVEVAKRKRDREKVLFTSKGYGSRQTNRLELRRMDNGEIRVWIKDGDVNALICMDREDLIGLSSKLKRNMNKAPQEVESFAFPLDRLSAEGSKAIEENKKLQTTSEINGVKPKRKERSDKGKKRGPRT